MHKTKSEARLLKVVHDNRMSGNSVRSSSQSFGSILPDAASHSYLGPGHSTIENCHILTPGETYEILLYPIPDVVLFPGQTIPLRIQNRAFIHKFLTMRQGTNSLTVVGHIGIINISQYQNLRYGTIAKVGTSMEVRSTYRSANDTELVVSGKGRYRFLIVSIKSELGVPIAQVKILSDNSPQCAPISPKSNPFPKWVSDQYSPQRLARIAYSLFESTMLWEGKDNAVQKWGLLRPLDPSTSVWSMYNTQFHEYEAENDPVGFSFFLSANMPVAASVVQMLLESECVVQRLRLIISLLRTGLHKRIACASCGLVLATKQDLFNVSGAEGLAAVYVNRYGSVHQTLTVRKLKSDSVVRYQGRPSTQDTWFPGYAWTIMGCSRCFSHLGWRYTWVGEDVNNDGDDENNSSLMSDEDGENEDVLTIENDGDDDNDYETIGEDEEEDDDDDNDSRTQETNSLENEENDHARMDTLSENSSTPSLESLPHQSPNSYDDDENQLLVNTDTAITLTRSSSESHSSDNIEHSSSQAVLQQFWGLTRAAIREV